VVVQDADKNNCLAKIKVQRSGQKTVSFPLRNPNFSQEIRFSSWDGTFVFLRLCSPKFYPPNEV
jgi:hypothetical protein